MASLIPFILTSDGTMFAVGDGPELLVYDARDGGPMWKDFCEDVLVGLAITPEHVVAVDGAGLVTFWRALDGVRMEQLELGVTVLAVASTPEGLIAASAADAVHFVHYSGPPQRLEQPGAVSIAFGPGGASLGLGFSDGRFTAIELETGVAWGTVDIGEPVSSVAWSALGLWVVCAGSTLCLVTNDATEVLHRLPGQGGVLSSVSASQDGVVAAARVGDSAVAVFELRTPRRIGQVTVKRDVGDTAFGPGAVVGFGLDDGDANLVDLYGGGLVRTEPHTGRGRNTWHTVLEVDVGAVRGAVAMQQAGGEALATYTGWRPGDDDEGGGGCLRGCLTCMVVTVVLTLMCGGCSGVLFLLRAYHWI